MPLLDINQVRSIEWSRSYMWDIAIPSAPSPFNDWFPASNVTEPLASVESYNFEVHVNSFSVPKSVGRRALSITFNDADDRRLETWIKTWMTSTIFPTGGVAGLKDTGVIKDISITKFRHLNKSRVILSHVTYICYPEGELMFQGGSTAEATVFTVNFVVVGINPGK